MERTRSDKASCDGAAARSHSSGEPALQDILTGAPSWLGSAIIHAVVILILCQMRWSMAPEDTDPIQAQLKESHIEEIEPQEEPKPPKNQEEPDLTNDVLPEQDVDYIAEVEMDQPDVNMSGFNTEEPDDAPPLAITKLALRDKGAIGHFHGTYGSRGGAGRRSATLRYGGSRISQKAVIDGFGWLARAQEEDGHWDARRWGGGNVDAAVTGLALLAFLGHGETELGGRYSRNVRKALEWLEGYQMPNGSFKARFYTQGICTMAASEAYGLSRNPRWKSMAQKAIDFCVKNQNPQGGWDYTGNTNRVDTSVTGWVVMALKSGVVSGLDVPPEALSRIRNWLKWSVNPNGLTGYSSAPGTPSGGTVPMTAVATLGRQFMGWQRNHPDVTKGLAYIDKAGVDLNNMYSTYYCTLTMFQAGGQLWTKWNKAFRDALIAKQVKGRGLEFDGSWDPTMAYGSHGGRVYATAMSVFCLEIYYRFLPLLKADNRL